MERHVQNKSELIAQLNEVKTDWKDEFSSRFLDFLDKLPVDLAADADSLQGLLDEDFEHSMLLFRLAFEQSKDEFTITLKSIFFNSQHGSGVKLYKQDPPAYVSKLLEYGLSEKLLSHIKRKFTWKDILIERLKGGRGSAIKGQTRGRNLEDFVEVLVTQLYASYDTRVSFIGKDGDKKTKADFVFRLKTNPIL